MKSILTMMSACLIATQLNAQKLSITNGSENLGGSYNPTFQVFIPHANEKSVEKKWKSLLKDYRAKVKSSKDDINGTNFVLKEKDTMQVYSRIIENADGITLNAAFSREGVFITPTTDQNDYDMLSKLLHDFALPIAKEGLEKKVDNADDLLKKKSKEHDNLVKRNEKIVKENEKMKEKISDNEREATENETKIGSLKTIIDQQKTAVEDVKSKSKDLQ